MTKPPRLTQPRRWTTLAAASVSLAAALPGQAEIRLPQLAIYAAPQDATLWTVQAEGGEGGESGAVAGAAPDVAYLGQISIVEGHMIAAATLYRNGLKDEAIGLSYHPEAEMMDEVRSNLAARGAADFTPLMTAISTAMEADAPADQVDVALADLRSAIATVQAAEADELQVRAGALVILVKAAADEYAGSITDGKVEDVMAYNEAHAFIAVARDLAAGLPESLAKQSARIIDALSGTDEAFGDLTSATPEARDPAILAAIAARVELIAYSVK